MDAYLISLAFTGCSKSFVQKMKAGLTEQKFNHVCQMLNGYVEPVKEHQDIILSHLEFLESTGVIEAS